MKTTAHLYECGIDYGELLARVENDQTLLCELLTILDESFPQNLQRLQEAIREEDAMRARACAHAVKGMLGTLSFWRAFSLAQDIERISAGGTVQDLSAKTAQLEKEVVTAQHAMQELCAGGGA